MFIKFSPCVFCVTLVLRAFCTRRRIFFLDRIRSSYFYFKIKDGLKSISYKIIYLRIYLSVCVCLFYFSRVFFTRNILKNSYNIILHVSLLIAPLCLSHISIFIVFLFRFYFHIFTYILLSFFQFVSFCFL